MYLADLFQQQQSPDRNAGASFMHIKKNQAKAWFFLFALPIFPGRLSIVLALKNMPVAYFSKKTPRPYGRGFVFALPIFPGSHPPSIVGVHELNFCVRDGNRWTLMTINTNYVMALTIFIKDLVTHTGFEPMLTA